MLAAFWNIANLYNSIFLYVGSAYSIFLHLQRDLRVQKI